MTVRSLLWILLTLRTVLSCEDTFKEDLSNKPYPGFKMDILMMLQESLVSSGFQT